MPPGSASISVGIPRDAFIHLVHYGSAEVGPGDWRLNKNKVVAFMGRNLATVKCPELGEGCISAHESISILKII